MDINLTQGYAILGGTFNPIHYGHLQLALAVKNALQLEKVFLMPSYIPVHRQMPRVSLIHRVAMLQLALNSDSRFKSNLVIDNREILRNTPSYTIDTLKEVRADVGANTPIYFIMGMDSLMTLNTWHNWQDFITLGNLIISYRPLINLSLPESISQYCAKYSSKNFVDMRHSIQGKILISELINHDISSTRIREYIYNHRPMHDILPAAVASYIRENGLYV